MLPVQFLLMTCVKLSVRALVPYLFYSLACFVQTGRSLLMLAAMNNSIEIVQLLLDEGVNVNTVEQVQNFAAV